jgi:hypothetical protein
MWRLMRENWLSNRVFKSFNAWNTLIERPCRIISIGI